MESKARKRGRPRSFNDKSEANTIQSLDKAMRVLHVVANANGLSLTELAETAETTPPTAYRILITLQNHGMVAFDETQQLWRIGVEAFRIGSTFLTNSSIVERARPVMQWLSQETGETANLGSIESGAVVFLSQVETHQPIRAFFRPGSRGAIHASGIGKALFAHLPAPEYERLCNTLEFDQFTTNTITKRAALAEMRESVRNSGFALDDEERTVGMRCIAAPIFNVYQEAVAAISVSGPSIRITDDQIENFALLVCEAAEEVTNNVGGVQPVRSALQ